MTTTDDSVAVTATGTHATRAVSTDRTTGIRDRFERAASRLDVDTGRLHRLLQPSAVYRETIWLSRDDGGTDELPAIRVQHDTRQGPCLGGLRYHPDASVTGCRRRAALATWQHALFDLPFGGSMGAVAVDPANLSVSERERLARRYAEAFQDVLGPHQDVVEPGAGTGPRDMGYLADARARTAGEHPGSAVAGKPATLGGLEARPGAAGRSLAVLAREACDRRQLPVTDATVAVCGYGAVGATAARLLDRWGMDVVALGDSDGCLHDPDGVEPHAVPASHETDGGVTAHDTDGGGSLDDPLSADVDLLVPATPGGAISPAVASDLQASVVVEGATGPTTAGADAVLDQHDVTVVPDILANAGGALVSAFEWRAGTDGDDWSPERVDNELSHRLLSAYRTVRERRLTDDLDWRAAAYAESLARLRRDRRSRRRW
ncbi:Glu/Leu/Phe/Val family dehydrogenase [Haloarchaeobius amylolyticus]|uniref:Glu/Leu/Phe/Val family dehydrogenase n=1 Tax=Haloarchaeobius amylolyticus TaxID=1198296 RepID=UPI00226FB994|nr:Glu/Leu/Phe/Val dehydrogenase [Haloarchaeobius amylolyticus]